MRHSVYIGVCGRFHAFPIAAELNHLGILGQLLCADKSLLPPRGLPISRYNNRFDLAVMQRIQSRLLKRPVDHKRMACAFDKWLSKNLQHKDAAIFHGWNTHVAGSLRLLKGAGWKTVVERSCPHNMFQHRLLMEESRLLNVPYKYDLAEIESGVQELYEADVISAPSRYSCESYTDPELLRKVRVVPLGSNFTWRNIRRSSSPHLNVLMVGNNFLRKGTFYLLEAFRAISDPNARLTIRGDVPEELRSQLHDTRVTIVPSVRKRHLEQLYREANVFCLPSIDDGFGLVALEALSFGLPVVVTENVGAADVIRSSAVEVVPIRCTKELVRALNVSLEKDPDMIAVDSRNIVSKNSWQGVVKRLVKEVYEIPNGD